MVRISLTVFDLTLKYSKILTKQEIDIQKVKIMIESICHDGTVVAIVIYNEHHIEENKIEFISPEYFSLQLGMMNRPRGYKVIPHIHNPVRRKTIGTQEVLLIKKGKILIDFYSCDQIFLESRELSKGDVILLCGAGHGITVLEQAIIIEVKNGPFIAGSDKGRFEGKDLK